ncbi:MAG: FAD-dependent oxidoreductase [Hyphomicrobium sp.]
MLKDPVTVVGAGILGLWQALTLARAGYEVTIIERNKDPFEKSTSRLAGTLLSPWTEAEACPDIVRDLGIIGLKEWCTNYPGVCKRGILTIAATRDEKELKRFAKLTKEHEFVDQKTLSLLEPQLAERFNKALFFPEEAHLATPEAMSFLLQSTKNLGAKMKFGETFEKKDHKATVINCSGLGARNYLKDLRGVRGERLLVQSHEVQFSRPIRLLHPRNSIYVVPWGNGRYVIGATMIESEDDGQITVRSTLELLGAAYTLHPAFGEAQILEMAAGIRPAFPDNIPRAKVANDGKEIYVNGAYRHGFLLAPVLAHAVANFLLKRSEHPLLIN